MARPTIQEVVAPICVCLAILIALSVVWMLDDDDAVIADDVDAVAAEEEAP